MLNKELRILLFSSLIWFFGEGMLGPLFAVFAGKIGGDILDISIAWSLYLIAMGIMMIIIGKLSDTKINKKKLMLTGYTLNAALTFCYLLVDNPLQLLIVQVGLGIATALATPTWDALYSRYAQKHNCKSLGTCWGLSDGLEEIVTGIAIILGGLVVVYISFTTLFVIMGIIQTIAVIALIPLLKKRDIF
jgi:MFS family permease